MKEYLQRIDKYSLVREKSNIPKVKITNASHAAEYARSFWEGVDINESFYVIMLNRANNTMGFVKIGQGGISSTVADPKLIAKYTMESLASSIIVIHNHPSGNVQPSGMDKKLTKAILGIMKYLEVSVLDHIILSPDNDEFYSFADNGVLDKLS